MMSGARSSRPLDGRLSFNPGISFLNQNPALAVSMGGDRWRRGFL
jgi:hypothetical protein